MGKYGGHIEERPSSYRVSIRLLGKRFRYSLPKKEYTKREAYQWATSKHLDLEAEYEKTAAAKAGAIHLSSLIGEFEAQHLFALRPGSQKPYHALFSGLKQFFSSDPMVKSLGSGDIKQYLYWRKKHVQAGKGVTLSDRSINKERSNLLKLFSWAIEMEYLDMNPVSRVSRLEYSRPGPAFITDAQYEALLKHTQTNAMVYAYAAVLGEAGLRCESEALWLRWSDVHFGKEPHLEISSGRHLEKSGAVHTTKTKKSRYVPMSPLLAKVMKEHFLRYQGAKYNGKRSPWVFHHEITRRNAVVGDRIGTLRKSFNSACKQAELPEEFTMHDLRHRRCTSWLVDGIPIYSVKEAMGHSSVKTTEWYTHFTKQHLGHFHKEDKAVASSLVAVEE